MRKTIYTSVLALLCTFGLSAQSLPSLICGADAASLGTASASVAEKAGAYALDHNAAAMSFGEKKFYAGATFDMWQPSYANNKILSAGATFRITDALAVGASLKNFSYPSYDITTESGSASRDGSFTPKEFNVALGASYAVTSFLSIGATARILKSSLANDASASAFGADFGVFYKKDNLRAGLSLNNLGTKVTYGENSYSQPSLLKAGVGYDLGFGTSALALSAEADYLFDGALMAGIGAEYAFKDLAFVRCGFHYGDEAKSIPSYASVGLGVNFFGVSLDAAYLFGSKILGNSLGVTLGYSF